MSNRNLCELWEKFVKTPDDPAIAEEARQHLVQFLSHVDDCDQCRGVSEKVADAERVFDALCDVPQTPLSAEEEAQLQAGHAAFAAGDRAIEEAVTTALLPSLPDSLQPPSSVTPMQLFLATDAVNLLARSVSAEYPDGLLKLTVSGLFAGDTRVSNRLEIGAAIAEQAGVNADIADDLFTWQVNALGSYSRLYRGLLTLALDSEILLARVPSRSADELAALWTTIESEVIDVPDQIVEVLPVPLSEYVEAASSILGAETPALEELGATLQNAGEPELAEFLVAQSQDEKVEKAEFIDVLKMFKNLQRGSVAQRRRAEPQLKTNRFRPKQATVKSKYGYSVAALAKRRILKRRRVYEGIMTCEKTGAATNGQPFAMFAQNGLKRADVELAYLANIKTAQKFYGGA